VNYRPYSVYKVERLLRRRRRRLLFGAAGLVLAIALFVGGWYLWLYLEWQKTQITDEGVIAALESTPTTDNLFPAPAGTMDILVLGVDHTGYASVRSDSLMIVHADPVNNYLSTLSLPRDLRVEVPGSGMQKLNFAYAHGGRELAIATVKQLTGVNVTEYLEISFNAFQSLTQAVGGVYVDVDKHYLQTDPTYEMINLLPGYQLLDGAQGLDYVRYRKDENLDFGRQARQQRYLTALREQAAGWDIGLKLPGIVQAMTDNIQTTISFEEVRDLAYWALTDLGGSRIRQMVVLGSTPLIDGVYYTVPEPGVLEQKVRDLLTPPVATGSVQTTLGSASTGTTVTTLPPSATVDASGFVTDPNMVADSAIWRQIAVETPFKTMAPGYLPPGYVYHQRNPEGAGGYDINTGSGTEKGLKVVYKLTGEGARDQYLGIMETTWLKAPAASAGRQVAYKGITYTIVGGADFAERVWWTKDGVLYWVSNTIMHRLSSNDLVKIAASMISLPSGATP
jgi:LCP family protein required for cell wall assembly